MRSSATRARVLRMAVKLRYRGREVSDAEVAFIEELIKAHPEASRRALSKKLCEAWGWVQPNGELRDMVCRSLIVVSQIISPAIVQGILWQIWPVFPHWMHRWDSVGRRSNLGRAHQSMGGGAAEAMGGTRRCSSGNEEERAAGGCPPQSVQKFSGSSKSNRSGCAPSSWSRSPRRCSMRTSS